MLTTKSFIPPHGTRRIVRRRLFERLGEVLSPEVRLALVCAPAGYGKTTLVSEWVYQLGGESESPIVCWLSLGSEDNDPILFFANLTASLQKVFGEGNQKNHFLMQSPQPLPLESLFTILINDLAGQKSVVLIVLDDYQMIHHDALIQKAMSFFIDHLPPNVHLIFTTRSDPPLALQRYRGRGQMIELRADDLRFSLQEVTAFVNDLSGFGLGEQELEILLERTEGWAAGIQMAGLSLRGRKDGSQFVHSLAGSRRYILDYLAEEVLNTLPEAAQQFLLQTSILERFCTPLCAAMLEETEHSAQEVLDMLERANLFLIPLDIDHTWYRYHHLFADLLQVRLKQYSLFSAEQISILYRRAAIWLAKNGWLREAIQYSIMAGDYETAGQWVEKNTLELLARGELLQLVQWTRLLPADLVNTRPWLSIAQAWTLGFAAKNPEAQALIQQAEISWSRQNLSEQEQKQISAEINALRSLLAVTSGKISETLRMTDTLLPERPFTRSVFCWAQGYAWRMSGNLLRAIPAFEETLRLGEEMQNPWTIATAVVDLGVMLRASGKLGRAEAVYRQGLNSIQQLGAGELGFVGRVESFLASILYDRNELSEAEGLVRRSIEHNRSWDNPNHSAHGYFILGRICFGKGDLSAAQKALDAAQEIIHKSPVVPPLRYGIEALNVRLWLKQGKLAPAREWLLNHPFETVSGVGQIDEIGEIIGLACARIALACAESQQAAEILMILEKALRSQGKVSALIEVLLLKTRVGKPSEACESLLEALELGYSEGFVRVYLDEGQGLLELIEPCLHLSGKKRSAGQQELLQQILQVSGAVPQSQPKPTLLTRRELEVLAGIAAGLSNPEIGARLYISAGTVKAHTAAIFRKLEVARRSEAIARAKDLGLI